METESGQIPAGWRKLVRQDAVERRVDFADSPGVSTRLTSQQVVDRMQSSSHPMQNLPVIMTGKTPAKCQDSSGFQAHHHHSTKQDTRRNKELLARYNQELALYQQLLKKCRSKEMVCYDWGTESRDVKSKEPRKRRDISDGLPVSPSDFLRDCKQDMRVIFPCKDSSDVLPLITSERQDQQRISRKKSNLSCSYDDEGFNNDSLIRSSVSRTCSSSLIDIQEKAALEFGPDSRIPDIVLNDGVKNSLSESGKQKGEGFRQSKKSSGYGSGGSREAGSTETDDYSSVFLSTENPTDRDRTEGNDLTHNRRSWRKQSSGERQVELKDSSLPFTANVWRFEKRIRIPQELKDRYKDIDKLTPQELEEFLEELIKANPMNKDIQLKLDAERNLETTEEDLGIVDHDLGGLSSASWANELRERVKGSGRATSDYETSEEIVLQLSEESAPSNLGNSPQELNPDHTALDKEAGSSDKTDGKEYRCVSNKPTLPSSYTSKGNLANGFQPPSHLGHGYGTPSNSYLQNGYDLPRDFPTGYGSARNSPNVFGSPSPLPSGYGSPSSCASAPPSHLPNGYGSSSGQLHNGYIPASQLASERLNLSNQATVALRIDAAEDARNSQQEDAGTMEAGQNHRQLRAKGLSSAKNPSTESKESSRASSTNTEAPRRASQSVPGRGLSPYHHRDGSHMYGKFCMERSTFCQNSSCEDLHCLKGKRLILALQNAFQSDRITHYRNILGLVRHHSTECQELDCRVPFCDIFRKRPDCLFEEQLKTVFSGPVSQRLHMEMATTVMKAIQSGEFLLLSSSSTTSHTVWQTARVRQTQVMGEFGDFNILRGSVSVEDHDTLDVVFKKAPCHKGTEDAYFRVNRKSSPYIVESYWCSRVMDDTLLICSAYQNLDNLHTVMMHADVPMHPSVCLKLIQQVLRAVQFLHSEELEIAYLNWKCSSILWDGQTSGANIKLCNFSRAIRLEPGRLNKCPVHLRSFYDPRFTAPEVFCDQPLSFFADIWGIGCLLCEMLTKSPPYPDHAHESPAKIRELICCHSIQPTIPDIAITEDHGLLDIFCHCWEMRADKRCSVEELQEKVATLLWALSDKNMPCLGAEMER